MTKHGFYSIARKKPGEYHVRARERHDLDIRGPPSGGVSRSASRRMAPAP
jgi:hypothetical protein